MPEASYCINCWRAYKRSLATSEKVRKWHLSRAYGVTPAWVEEQLARQKSACAICSCPISLPVGAVPKRDEAHVDHDHCYGLVRELLCGKCNRGLGCFEDDTERLLRAVAYLKKHAKTPADVDAHLIKVSEPAPEKRGPRQRVVQNVPESVDSIVSRLGEHHALEGDVIDVLALPSGEEPSR